MTIHKQIKDGIKEAMIAKDTVRLTTLRGVSAAFMNELVAKKVAADELADEDAIAIIRKLVKQRKDSIEQFTKGGRPELAEAEEAEMKILETFLPQLMSKEEVIKVIEAKKAAMGTVDKAAMGQFMGAVMKDLKGKADGMMVKEVIEEMFK
jgi:uncharacterized protein YqeY